MRTIVKRATAILTLLTILTVSITTVFAGTNGETENEQNIQDRKATHIFEEQSDSDFPTGKVENDIENTTTLVIVDSYTGNVVQDSETVNAIINLIDSGENDDERYYLEPISEKSVNSVNNEAVLVIEDSITGDIVQIVNNNTYITNIVMSGSESGYRLRHRYDRANNERGRRHEKPEPSPEPEPVLISKPKLDQNVYGLEGWAEREGNYIFWDENDDYGYGYRLYRDSGYGYISVTDFPIYENFFYDEIATDNLTYSYYAALITSPATRYNSEETGPCSMEIYINREGFNKTTIEIPIGSSYMYVNGKPVEIDPGRGTKAQISSNRTFLPVRALIESVGGVIYWDATENEVAVHLDGNTLNLWIGKKEILVNHSYAYLDVSPFIANERVFLPLRAFSNLGLSIEWDGENKTAYVSK